MLSIRTFAVVFFGSPKNWLQTGRASDLNVRGKLGGSNVLAKSALWVRLAMDRTEATGGTASAVTARWLEPVMWFDHIGWWREFRSAHILASIQIAMAIMPRFSVRETKPSGTLEEPPTHAHLSSRLST
jgi:hypothetical protein